MGIIYEGLHCLLNPYPHIYPLWHGCYMHQFGMAFVQSQCPSGNASIVLRSITHWVLAVESSDQILYEVI